MVKKIIYLDVAINDLLSIYNYIGQDSKKYARLEVKKIKAFIESLKSYPTKGRYYKTINERDIRSVLFKHYNIFYKIDEYQIDVLTIHHQSRSIANNPAFKEGE